MTKQTHTQTIPHIITWKDKGYLSIYIYTHTHNMQNQPVFLLIIKVAI
jgi:hypothetical protein